MQLQRDDDSAEDVRPYHIPKTATLRQLMCKALPAALAVSCIDNQIFVELPQLPRSEHVKRLGCYPGWFAHNGGPKLFYYNRMRVRTKLDRGLRRSMGEDAGR